MRQLSSLKVQTERHTSLLKNETLWLVEFEEIFNLIPRLFVSLPPFVVVDRKTLVVAGHVTTCDSSIAIRVGSTNNINFCRSQLERKKGRRSLVLPVIKPHTCKYTFQILHYYSHAKLHTGQTNIFACIIQRNEVSL